MSTFQRCDTCGREWQRNTEAEPWDGWSLRGGFMDAPTRHFCSDACLRGWVTDARWGKANPAAGTKYATERISVGVWPEPCRARLAEAVRDFILRRERRRP